MAVAWSDTMANAIIDTIIRQVAFPVPAACWAGLYTSFAEPTATSIGSAVEAGYTGYTRAQLTSGIMAAAAARQTVSSGGQLSFGTPTAAIDALPLRWIALWSASSSGTFLGYGQLSADVLPLLNQALTISSSNLVIRQT